VPDGIATVPAETNRGVAPGWNAAAHASRGDVLVFANDDVEAGAGAFARLAAALDERDDAGVVGPHGARWDRSEWRHVADVHPAAGLQECDAISGFLFATRRSTWEAVGGFDEAYAPASWEEIDFNVAVQSRLGLRSYAVGGVDVAHEWGISARQPVWRTVRWGERRELLWSIHRRNRRHFLAKWA
jgi:GT2 family glycosyltransferase